MSVFCFTVTVSSKQLSEVSKSTSTGHVGSMTNIVPFIVRFG